MHHPDTLAMRADHVADESGQRHRRMTVLIAEDHYLMREGTRRLLAEREDVEVVGVAADYDGVLSEARRLRPDVVLMDIKMPPTYAMEGIAVAHAIKEERPETGVVILTQHDNESYVWELLRRGVAGYGYLHKVRVGDVDQLVRAMREVAAGGVGPAASKAERPCEPIRTCLSVGAQPDGGRSGSGADSRTRRRPAERGAFRARPLPP